MAQGDFWDLLDAVESCDSAEVDIRFTRYTVHPTSEEVQWSDVQPGKEATAASESCKAPVSTDSARSRPTTPEQYAPRSTWPSLPIVLRAMRLAGNSTASGNFEQLREVVSQVSLTLPLAGYG